MAKINGDAQEKTEEEFKEDQPLNQPIENGLEVEERKRTFSETCGYVFRNVTVEPTILLFVMSCMIGMLTTQNLFIEKACRVNLNYSDEICTSLKQQQVDSQNEYEREAQKLIASLIARRTYISATIPSFIALLVGSWSDRTGHRKIFLVIPLVGQMLMAFNNIMNVYFFEQLSLEVLVYSEALIEAFSGGWCLCFLTIFSYISAITTNRDRTFRMGLINFSLTVGFPIGMGLSGVLLKNLGYVKCYLITASIHFINMLYCAFVVKNPQRTIEQKKHDGKSFLHFIRTLFDLSNVKNSFEVICKTDENNRRFRMILCLAVICLLFGPMYGEISVLYISTRYRFNWDEIKFSLFQTYNFVTHTLGTIFSITVFSKYLQWHDSILGIISTLSKIAGSFIYCFASNERIFFIAPIVEILNGTALLAMRSIISKLVAPDELGRVNSVISLTENLMPLVYVPLYTKVYTATMEVLPGFVFLLGAAMTIPTVCVFSWLFYDHRKKLRREKHAS